MIEIVNTDNPLLAAAPWAVLYGEHGARCFKTRKQAERWIETNRVDLEAGVNPDTGQPG